MRRSMVRDQLAAAGEFPLVIAYANIIQYLAEKGAPMDWVPLAPAMISVNTVMLGAKASLPNAARLLIDFTLSKEGQEKLWDFNGSQRAAMSSPSRRGFFAATSVTWSTPRKCKREVMAKLYAQISRRAASSSVNTRKNHAWNIFGRS